MNITLKKNQIIFITLSLLIRILLDFIFIDYISVEWMYQGFILDLNYYKIVISYLMFFIFVLMLLFYQKHKISHFFVILLFYVMYVPLGIIYGYMNTSTTFFVISTISIFLLIFGVVYLNRSSNSSYNSEPKSNNYLYSHFYWIIIIISILTFFLMTIQNYDNINISSVINLADVYSVRENAQYGFGMNYFFSWQTKVINPYMISYAHLSKRKKLEFVFILHQLWMYILTGHKMVLFTLIIIFIIENFLYKFKDLQLFFSKSLFYLVLIAILEIILTNASYIVDYVLRRIMFIPALLNNYYYEFFSNYGFQHWRHTLIGKVFNAETDFNVVPSLIIGEEYFNNPEANSVTGYLGNGYMNAGIFGVLIATFIIIILFILIDKITVRIGQEIVLITLLTPMYSLWNTALTTTLLTGGLIIGMLLLYFTKVRYISKNPSLQMRQSIGGNTYHYIH